jgi:hypothetical protein
MMLQIMKFIFLFFIFYFTWQQLNVTAPGCRYQPSYIFRYYYHSSGMVDRK